MRQNGRWREQLRHAGFWHLPFGTDAPGHQDLGPVLQSGPGFAQFSAIDIREAAADETADGARDGRCLCLSRDLARVAIPMLGAFGGAGVSVASPPTAPQSLLHLRDRFLLSHALFLLDWRGPQRAIPGSASLWAGSASWRTQETQQLQGNAPQIHRESLDPADQARTPFSL